MAEEKLDEKKFHLLKSGLQNGSGISYTEFKKTLKPKYKKVWVDIFFGWSIIILTFFLSYLLLDKGGVLFKIMFSLIAASLVGYMIAYLVNFFHEAAHYNLTENKRSNDRLANIFIGILIAQGIKNYRIVHWQHHIAIGTTADTERSYFESLDAKFIIFSLTGISALQFFFKRNKFVTGSTIANDIVLKKEKKLQFLISLLFHLLILVACWYWQQYWLMAIWIVAVGSFYPFFNRLRQLIEHRSDKADKKIDYSKTEHGKLTRIFGNSLLDRTFGSAGFNKHLLHHFEPTISYTQLNEMEKFLMETSLGPSLRKQRSSYLNIFVKLFNR